MEIGSFVVNKKVPKWGIGKVIEKIGDNKLKIFFEFAGEKVVITEAANLAIASGVSEHYLLDNLETNTDIKKFSGFIPLQKAFLKKFPQGFSDSEYLVNERNYKSEASLFLRDVLSQEHFEALIDSDEYNNICEIAQQVVNKTNLIFPNEKMALRDGLKKSATLRRLFGKKLFLLLYSDAPMKGRFESFVSALDELDATKWTTATYFLALSQPDKFPFIKPQYYKEASNACHFDIMYKTHPNWASYDRMIDFNKYLTSALSKCSKLVPRDLIDVQGFIWCSLQKD